MASTRRGIRNIGGGASQIARGVGQVAQGVGQAARGLLNKAASSVEAVINALVRQQNALEQQVQRTIQAIIAQVVGGVWVGAGADAFVNELQTEFLPLSASLDSSIAQMIQSVRSAEEIVEEADKQASQVADIWGDLVDAIF